MKTRAALAAGVLLLVVAFLYQPGTAQAGDATPAATPAAKAEVTAAWTCSPSSYNWRQCQAQNGTQQTAKPTPRPGRRGSNRYQNWRAYQGR